MFRSKPRIDISSTDTLLGEGSRFEGRLQSKASLRIEGEIIGAASLIIAEGAVFEGSCKMESTCAPEEPAAPQPADAPRSLDGESAAQPV